MTLRHVVFQLLVSTPTLQAVVGTRIFDANSLGTPTGKNIPAKPFIVTMYGPDTLGPDEAARVQNRTVDVYMYGEPGDYTIVEHGLREVRTALQNATGWYEDPATHAKTWLNYCRLVSTSGDLYDDIYRANCRYETYRLVGNTP